MSKVRVYEVARDLGIENKALVALFQSVGVTEVRNHMSAVAPEQVERVKRHLEKATAAPVVEERIRPTVVKRRAVKKPKPEPVAEAAAPAPPVPAPARRVAPPKSQPRVAPPPEAKPEPVKVAPAPEKPAASTPKAAPPPAAVEAPPTMAAAAPEPAPEAPPAPAPKPVEVAAVAKAPEPDAPAPRPSSPPKTGVEVWEGRPGVPMPQAPRGAPTPRRVQYDAKAGGNLGGRGRGPMMGGRMGGRGMRHRGLGSLGRAKGSGQPVTQERSAHKKVVKIEETIALQTLAQRLSVKSGDLLMKLIRLGMTGVNINSTLDAETSKIVAGEFGWEVEDVAVSEENALLSAQGLEVEVDNTGTEPRPPVVTVMGHVDHGKTSLLDRIRKANVVAGEAGGITQHIGAYSVETKNGRLAFLDTPGHEAFTAMRARGAQTTDVVILVVAADDGVMPQTIEAINHAKAAEVALVVAINKCDKPEAQPERVRRELSEHGLVPEEWGGDTLFCEVSAATGDGVDALLEQVVLQAEVLELRATADKPGVGVVVEAELDRGKGPVATILVQDGTLKRGDVILAGSVHGKIRAMLDDRGRNVATAGPSTPVAIIGLSDVPAAGDPVHAITDLKKAQEIADQRKTKERRSMLPTSAKISLEELARAMSENEQLELKVIIKADVQGSVEALTEALLKLTTEKVKVGVVHAAVGAITEGDVNLAVAAKGIIIGFNVRPAGKSASLAQKESVEIRQYNVIYHVVDDVKAAMEGLLAPQLVEKDLGKAEVRQTFRVSKAGTIAGCMVVNGLVRRSATARLVRDDTVLWTGKVSSLKRFKDDAREVKEGMECGIGLENFNDVKAGDFIEFFEIEEVKQTL